MRQVWIPKPGPPAVLEVREAPDPFPGAGEIRIRVEAAGVNFADIMGRLGIYPDLPKMPCVPGYEVAGQVDAVGNGVETDWIGRDVIALTRFGGYSDVVCVPEIQAAVRPDGLDAQAGAALLVNYLTAWQLIDVMGNLRDGDTMLVHSAGGGVGIAAVQIARQRGARVIGTASQGKHAYLESIGVEACIDYTSEDFEKRVMEHTSGRGVELVLDAVGGRSFAKSYRALAPTGRLGMFGMSTGAPSKRRSPFALLRVALTTPWFRFTPLALMDANKGVFGVNLGHLWEEADRVAGWIERLLDLFREGALRPVVAERFALEAASDAHHYIQDRRNLGKVLLVP